MARYKNHSARIAPVSPPLERDIQEAIDAIMRGAPPLVLFTTMARDRKLFFKFFNSGLLDRGNLTIRQREIVIDRVTACCGAEYEWGLHISAYGAKAEVTEAQIASLVAGALDDGCWADEDRVLIRLCDGLQRSCTVDDDVWAELALRHSDEAILELLMLAAGSGSHREPSLDILPALTGGDSRLGKHPNLKEIRMSYSFNTGRVETSPVQNDSGSVSVAILDHSA
jgi:hypothetical protein